MTKKEMIVEMFDKGYHSQYDVDFFVESFTDTQIKRMYDSFMDYLKTGKVAK